MWDKLQTIEKRYQELGEEIARPEVTSDYDRLQKLAREHQSLQEIMNIVRDYRSAQDSLEQARAIVAEGGDPELVDYAREEVAANEARIEELEARLRRALIPKGPYDDKDVIVEIRAAAGGDEASLFAGDLFRMYSRHAERRGWQVEVMDSHESDRGGFKEIVFEVRGQGVYRRLKHESGVHRVQRVPETEAQGRIHTSTATVAVLAEADEVEIDIPERDVKMDVFRSGGAGGQNVQKNATAVRLTHLPTGMVVQCQDERSQLQNRTRAMSILRARLYEKAVEDRQAELAEARRAQVGSGERAEKIRTYNFPQSRVTDHRIGLSLHNLPAVLDGGIDPFLDELSTRDQAERLQAAD